MDLKLGEFGTGRSKKKINILRAGGLIKINTNKIMRVRGANYPIQPRLLVISMRNGLLQARKNKTQKRTILGTIVRHFKDKREVIIRLK